jgi:CheY-like chemotaxis protein
MQAVTDFMPDVVVCDTALPGDAANTLVRTLRAEKSSASTAATIALIDRHRPDRIQTARDAGFERHLAKPVDPDALIGVIVELADRRTLRREA